MVQTSDPMCNHLLAGLSEDERRRWWPRLERVDLVPGQVLHEPGAAFTDVYFPTGGVVALLFPFEDGTSAQMGVVGNEGMVGVSLLLGGLSTTSRDVVQSAGPGFRIGATAVREECDRQGPGMHLLLRYTQAMFTQMALTAVCNRHHTIDQQLCCWLLQRLDRLHGEELLMTHELIADTLGVRRESVTAAARKLQAAGLIRYARGHMAVLDRAGLEHCSCECYGVVRREFDRLLPGWDGTVTRPAIAVPAPAAPQRAALCST